MMMLDDVHVRLQHDDARWCKITTDDARWCKITTCKMMMQDYNMMMLDDARLQHNDARWCKITTWWC